MTHLSEDEWKTLLTETITTLEYLFSVNDTEVNEDVFTSLVTLIHTNILSLTYELYKLKYLKKVHLLPESELKKIKDYIKSGSYIMESDIPYVVDLSLLLHYLRKYDEESFLIILSLL